MRILTITALLLAPLAAEAGDLHRTRTSIDVQTGTEIRTLPARDGRARDRGGRHEGGHKDGIARRAKGGIRGGIIVYDYARVPAPSSAEKVKPAEPDEPPAAAATPALSPPKPEGSIRLKRARGARAAATWAVGDVLPRRLPILVLNAHDYGLPALPDGQIYVRVRRAVLAIEAVSRRIVARPGT